jgi:hypothetical protein
MDRVRTYRDEFPKRVKVIKKRFVEMLVACLRILIHFYRYIYITCLSVLLRYIAALHYVLRNIETFS